MTGVIEEPRVSERAWTSICRRARTLIGWRTAAPCALRYGGALCLLLGFATRMVLGQEVSGVVVEGQSSVRVADIAIVVISPDGRVAGTGRTDEHGEFAIRLPKGGRYMLRALRMGYMPTELVFGIDSTTSVRVEFELNSAKAAVPYLMTPVVVRGRSVDLPTRLSEVYARAKRNQATIFTREDFVLTNDFRFALQSVPSVHLNARNEIIFRTCDKVQVYINGTRYSAPEDTPTRTLKLLAPADVVLMEVYTHVTRLPVEYMNDACAVIAVWTK